MKNAILIFSGFLALSACQSTTSQTNGNSSTRASSSETIAYVYSPSRRRIPLYSDRDGPGESFTNTISHGEKIRIIERQDEWYLVDVLPNRGRSWIRDDSVARSQEELNAPSPPSTGGGGIGAGELFGAAVIGTLVVAPIVNGVRNGSPSGASSTSETVSSNTNGQTTSASEVTRPARGVASVNSDGRVSGTNITASRVTCNNGSSRRIWYQNGQWWDLYGAQGGDSRSLQEQAEFLCR